MENRIYYAKSINIHLERKIPETAFARKFRLIDSRAHLTNYSSSSRF